MRIRMLTAIAGERWAAKAGDVVEMRDEKEAARLVRAGCAETATVGASENAAKRTTAPQPKRRGKENSRGKPLN